MSALSNPPLDAIALQLVAALGKYEADVDRMIETWLDMDLYRDVSDQVERIRMYSASLPALNVVWTELLIAHAELVHSLWRLRFQVAAGDRARLAEVRDRHSASLAALRQRCMRLQAR